MPSFSPDRAWTDAVAMVRAHADLLLIVAGVFLLLPNLANALFIPQPKFDGLGLNFADAMNSYIRDNGVLLFLLTLPVSLGQAAILLLLLDANRPTVGEALKLATRMLPLIVLLGWITNFATAIGIIAFIAPGLYLAARLLCAGAVQIVEAQWNPIAAIQRSLEMTRGNGWRIVGTIVLVFVVALVFQSAVSAVFGILFRIALPESVAEAGTGVVAAVLGTALSLVFTILGAAIYRQLAGAKSGT